MSVSICICLAIRNIFLTLFLPVWWDTSGLSYICKCQWSLTCFPILTTVSNLGYNWWETHYGQEQSRLSRDWAILSDDSTEVQWTGTFKLLSLLLLVSLRTSDWYLERLDPLFVDKFVYALHLWAYALDVSGELLLVLAKVSIRNFPESNSSK